MSVRAKRERYTVKILKIMVRKARGKLGTP